MSQSIPEVVYLKDYREPDFWIDETHLDVRIYDDQTLVLARLRIRPNKLANNHTLSLVGEGLSTLGLRWNNVVLSSDRYQIGEGELKVFDITQEGWLTTEVSILPQQNTSLEGLYRSRTMYCTQCEAEGFRKITWYLDRPDVMSVFTTRVEANTASCPVLLSNGNLVEQGLLAQGRHFTVWHDPYKKPSYLFALVAGDLDCVRATQVTGSGRVVSIEVYVEPKDLDKCEHAINSLKAAMVWDEKVYGREYDLDRYMIVAVDDFNMGAMENKGLNIFNTSCVLAKPETTTDAGFQRVEGVVAHEYFHNWSGNRVTCRDWFQLSLKEGFTVYRDSQFSADMNSPPVKRIEDVNLLRTAQFAEDAGPLAHAVRPESFIEISNFYTLTVYEKGAEIVRMLANLLGPVLFRQATDLYFERHDGQAVTCDDFVAAMESVSGRNLTQFKRWYSQAGTPSVSVSGKYDADLEEYQLTFFQSCRATPESLDKKPFHIPIKLSLIGAAGALRLCGEAMGSEPVADNTEVVLELTEATQTFTFTEVFECPVPSLFRDFSAPVTVDYSYTEEELLRLLSLDNDPFNRWSASQELAILAVKVALDQGASYRPSQDWLSILKLTITDAALDPAVLAYLLQFPSVSYLHDQMSDYDILEIHHARRRVLCELTKTLESELLTLAQPNGLGEVYDVSALQVANRTLKNTALMLLTGAKLESGFELAKSQFEHADNMTDQLAALKSLTYFGDLPATQRALNRFYELWQNEALVVNHWLSVQAGDESDRVIAQLNELSRHESFTWSNPNKVRALVSTFTNQNIPGFHRDDGSGYLWLADIVLRIDPMNPQLASRLVTPLTRWSKYGARGLMMREQLQKISAQSLSKDLFEVISKSLA